jgi:hypothetical protein
MEGVENPETTEGNKDAAVVLAIVLINTFVISSLDGVVTDTLTSDLGSLSSLSLIVTYEGIRGIGIKVVLRINATNV